MLLLARLARFRNSYLLRGLLCWITVRAVVSLGEVRFGVLTGLGVAGIVAAAVVLDAVRRREHVFFANLGISRFQIATVGTALPFVFEVVVLPVVMRGGTA